MANTPSTYMPALLSINLPETSGSTSTTFTIPIPPAGSNIATQFNKTNSQALLTAPSGGIIHISNAVLTTTAAQLVGLLAPLNWTTLAADGTATSTTSASITLTADPGLYATTYRPGLQTFPNAPNVTNNAISASDYVVYQGADGTWFSDVVAGVAGSTTITVGLTNGMPNVKKGSLVYFYGVVTDKDPATGYKRTQTTFVASSARVSWATVGGYDIAATLFPGDPMLVYCGNTDNATKLNALSGFYSWR